MKDLIETTCIELVKLRNTFTWWLVILGAGFIPLFVGFVFFNKWQHLIPVSTQNQWDTFADMSWKGLGFLYTPFFIVLLTCLFFNIEHRSNTWKHLFTLPVSKTNIYFSKLIALIILLFLFYVLFIPLWIAFGYLVGVIRPQLQLVSRLPNYEVLFSRCFHSFISSLGLLAIHFCLSIRFKNMVIPIAICVICSVIWVVLYQGKAEWIDYFPYSYHYSTVSPPNWIRINQTGIFPHHEIISIFYFVVFTGIGYIYFIKKFKG